MCKWHNGRRSLVREPRRGNKILINARILSFSSRTVYPLGLRRSLARPANRCRCDREELLRCDYFILFFKLPPFHSLYLSPRVIRRGLIQERLLLYFDISSNFERNFPTRDFAAKVLHKVPHKPSNVDPIIKLQSILSFSFFGGISAALGKFSVYETAQVSTLKP